MKKDETTRDRLMDTLLKEDARGGADEKFLNDLEQAIDASGEEDELQKSRRGKVAPWAWGLVAAASVTVVAGYGFMVSKDKRTLERDFASNSAPRASRPADGVPAKRMRPFSKPRESRRTVDQLSAPLIALEGKEEGKVLQIGGKHSARSKFFVLDDSVKANVNSPAVRDLRLGTLGRDRADRVVPADGEPAPGLGAPSDQPAPVDRERYGQLVDQPWNTPWQAPLSTFSVDVDTASYANIRRLLRSGATIPKDAVRIEECLNYFDYRYAAPQNGGPFAVHVDLASCPWQDKHHLVKIGLKGKEVGTNERPPSNLVFLIDVSGSMNEPNKLPLLVESMKILVEELDERDSVGIVVYAGSSGTLLEPTKVVANGRTEILSALDHLRAGGSTAGAAGIRGAYELAAKHYLKDGVNRVILATDGDFNVGTSSNGALVDLVKERAKSGVYLSVLGFGNGNLNDSMLEAITNDGNGNYFYIDTQREGRKVFLQNLSGTLVTIAKDVKIQVEFNPGKVSAYRLIGYANRILPPEAFNDDKIDAGDIGAGHTVTALYEVVPAGVEPPAIGGVDQLKYQKPANRGPVDSPEWFTVKLRYKAPDGDKSKLLELPVKNDPVAWAETSADFQFAASVALFGEKLRQSDKIGDAPWELVAEMARKGSGQDPHGHRREFLELVSLAGRLQDPIAAPNPVPGPEPVPGASGPETLEAMKNLARDHDQAGRLDEALRVREQVLLLSRKLFGPMHPETLAAMEALAGCYKSAGRQDEALALLEEVLTLSRKRNRVQEPVPPPAPAPAPSAVEAP